MIWKITENKQWEYLADKFDWINDMQQTEQDSCYHGEGNVAEHTKMVLSCLEEMADFQSLDAQSQEILWAAALLHDVEKRSTSVSEPDGRISSHGHARKGEYTVREILFRDIPAPFSLREQVAGLVRYHGLPIWLMERRDAQKKLFESAERIDTSLLKILSKADVLGRICSGKEQLLEQIVLFEMYCKEQECWGKARAFATFHARFHYFNTEDAYPGYVPHEKFGSRVILLSGLPGMGKDHLLKSRYPDWAVISLDDIRRKHKLKPSDSSATGWVVQQAKEQARNYLRKGTPFVWNATNITRLMRSQLIDLFRTYQAYVKIVYIEKPYSTWVEQNREREYPLPQAVLDKMLHKLEIPQVWEAQEIEYVC
jgi:putative nucleotidyltransferase with HDIG domain